MRFGLLLPHFGPSSTKQRLFEFCAGLGSLGFSSIWVRDHLGYTGAAAFESRSNHFLDPLITLAALARTSRLTLGTASLTPIRQPVVLAQMIGSLAYLADGNLILGVGLGSQPQTHKLVGRSMDDRPTHFKEMVEVLRATSHRHASYSGEFTRFENLTLDPAPPEDLPIWYCGASRRAIDRAVEYATGWLPGRCPITVFDPLRRYLDEQREGRAMSIGIVPLFSLGRTREEALYAVNVEGLLRGFRAKPAWRHYGSFDNANHTRGALFAGTSDDIAEDIAALAERGVEHMVIDLRERFHVFEESVLQLSEEVLPRFVTA